MEEDRLQDDDVEKGEDHDVENDGVEEEEEEEQEDDDDEKD